MAGEAIFDWQHLAYGGLSDPERYATDQHAKLRQFPWAVGSQRCLPKRIAQYFEVGASSVKSRNSASGFEAAQPSGFFVGYATRYDQHLEDFLGIA
jgi:hypothetical protein